MLPLCFEAPHLILLNDGQRFLDYWGGGLPDTTVWEWFMEYWGSPWAHWGAAGITPTEIHPGVGHRGFTIRDTDA